MNSQRISNGILFLSSMAGSRILAAVLLVYLAPAMLAVAFLIKVEANGPVLIRRRRCLSDGPVDLWEFRTTTPVNDGSHASPGDGGAALGAFLRVSRLDLLPRLVNMVRDEVTLGALFR